jgi:membrane-bound lytic murein transglycosylase F
MSAFTWGLAAALLGAAPAGEGAGPVAPASPPVAATWSVSAAAASDAVPGARAGARGRRANRAASRYDEVFRRYAKRYFGVAFDWRWFKAQGMAESNLDSAATSWVGARGIMQLMPSTYQAIQSRQTGFGAIDDPEWNIAAGIFHNRHLWRLWSPRVPDDDRLAFMFGSYNAGEGTIGRAAASAQRLAGGPPGWTHIEQVAPTVGRWRYRETLGYVRKIRAYHAELAGR